MAIAIDGSTPAGASQTNSATATVASPSFSPVASSLLLVSWAGNTHLSTAPGAPSIANTGGLSFTLVGHRSKIDGAGAASGQAALWYAVIAGAPGSMTVTVTSGSASGLREARIKPVVLTGVDTASPIVNSNEGTDNGGALDNLSYTSGAANSMGFAAVSDWDVASTTFTGAAGTTVVDSATPNNNINAVTLRQTTPGASGATVSLGLTSPTSTTWNYVWVEVREGSAAASASLIVPRRFRLGALLDM